MNLEAINKWLDEEYGCSYTKLEELHDFYFEKYCDLKQENKQLKEELEEYENPIKYFKYANKNVTEENKQLKEEKRKVRDYINKHCVNEKISKEVGYKCYTMADTNELEKIMKILGDKE